MTLPSIPPLRGFLILAAICCLGNTTFGADSPSSLPNVFYADPHAVAEAKAKLAAGDTSLKPALDRLLEEADKALTVKPPSVMEKHRIPPSGDKHDYVSQAPYFWRDTNSPDGKYIRRDGERNPESGVDSDAGRLGSVCSNVHDAGVWRIISPATKNTRRKAAELLRVFFLDPATKMNPNLNFGQGIPGEVDGRPTGLIGARGFVPIDGRAGPAGKFQILERRRPAGDARMVGRSILTG